jgi:hypothetical protein
MRGEDVAQCVLAFMRLAVALPITIAPFVDTLFDPYTPLDSTTEMIKDSEKQKIARVLGLCYRPHQMGPKNNLTTWIFGGAGKAYVLGKLHQMLRDHYAQRADSVDLVIRADTNVQGDFVDGTEDEEREEESAAGYDLQAMTEKANVARKDVKSLFDHSQGYAVEDLSGTAFQDTADAAFQEESADGTSTQEKKEKEEESSARHDLRVMAKKAGISPDDLELLMGQDKGYTLDELAKRHNLTKAQVRYRIKTLLKALQQAAKQA